MRRCLCSLPAEIWALALPALCAMLLDPVMNMIDMAIVGHLGTEQLGAVSMGSLSVALSAFVFSFLLFLTTPKVAAAAAVNGACLQLAGQRELRCDQRHLLWFCEIWATNLPHMTAKLPWLA